MVVEMLKSTKEKGAPVVTLIGDDDSTGFNRARTEVLDSMEKLSDTNHVKKNITNQLFKLKTNYKELSVMTINAIMKRFSYMLCQCRGDKEAVHRNLSSVVDHQFGMHDSCGSWCKMKTNPGEKHRNLPRGTDLHSSDLRRELLVIFNKLDVSKLAKLDSSNVNESFNNTLRSKAPKDKHYSESNSLQDRLAAAVCQKNDGYGYVSKVIHGQYIFTYKLQINIMSHFRSQLPHNQTFSRAPRIKLLI